MSAAPRPTAVAAETALATYRRALQSGQRPLIDAARTAYDAALADDRRAAAADRAAGILRGVRPPTADRTYAAGDCPCDCHDSPSPYVVPAVFFADHAHRACLGHDVTARPTGKLLSVSLRPCDARELLSDAAHYASSAADYGPDFFGLCSSARATVKRLQRAGVVR